MHQHHIIPKHFGGTDDPDNLVLLTVEEHAEAHRVLFEQYGRWQDLLAWKGLSGQLGKEELIRERIILSNKSRKGLYSGSNNPFYGRTHRETSKRLISQANKGNTVWKGRKHHSDSIEKIIKNHADFSGDKNPFYGKKHTEDVRSRIKEFMTTNNPSKDTYWINNGLITRRIKKSEPIPDGWLLGRKLKGDI